MIRDRIPEEHSQIQKKNGRASKKKTEELRKKTGRA